MSAPEKLRLKRKRTDEPPQSLILSKRQATSQNAGQLQYTRLQEDGDATTTGGTPLHSQAQAPANNEVKEQRPRRIFRLKRSFSPERSGRTRRDQDDDARVPTFEENVARDRKAPDAALPSDVTVAQMRKRPGKGSAVRSNTNGAQAAHLKPSSPVKKDDDLESLADQMHRFALEELAKVPRPTTTAKPKMSPARAKTRHEQRMASLSPASPGSTQSDVEMEDYVYDTYVLAPSAAEKGVQAEHIDDVGFIVIGEDDEELWDSYLEGSHSGSEVASDEDDENAEDYYAADYPEGELASDDEYNREAYGYRAHTGSDNEQWDRNTGNSSDDELERQKNPNALRNTFPARWQKYIGHTEEDRR